MLDRGRERTREDPSTGIGLTITAVIGALLLILPTFQPGFEALRIVLVVALGIMAGMITRATRPHLKDDCQRIIHGVPAAGAAVYPFSGRVRAAVSRRAGRHGRTVSDRPARVERPRTLRDRRVPTRPAREGPPIMVYAVPSDPRRGPRLHTTTLASVDEKAWERWLASARAGARWSRNTTGEEPRWSTGAARRFSSPLPSSTPPSAPSSSSSPTSYSTPSRPSTSTSSSAMRTILR